MRALLSICWRTIVRKRPPTQRANRMKQGKTSTPNRVNRHSSAIMMASVMTTVMALVMKVMKVSVMARCAPMTSLFKRLISSPACVCV